MYAEAEIKDELDKFKAEDPKLAIYYKTFYWTLTNYFQAYRVAST